MPSTILEIPLVSVGDADKEAAIDGAVSKLEGAIGGVLSFSGDANTTLTDTQALYNAVFVWTGALTTNRNLVVPNNTKFYLVKNSTTGGFAITVKTSAGTGVTVYPGEERLVRCDATNVIASAGGMRGAVYGSGSEGAVTISGNTTLAADRSPTVLTISSSAVLTAGGFRVQASQKILVNSGCAIERNGNNASGSTAGAALSAQTTGSSGAGGAGGTAGGAGSGGTSVSNSVGSSGGAGGAATAGGAAGSAGTASAPSAATGSMELFPMALTGILEGGTRVQANGGAGGGGGGASGANAGGGGGSGGGVLIIAAPVIENSGTISANGGNGANGAAANAGGGGGGGGGRVHYHCDVFSGNTPTATGGVRGNGAGTGANGTAGTDGFVRRFPPA